MDMTGTFVAAGIGAITGAGAGIFGSGLSDGLLAGLLSGGAVGFAFSLLPRSPGQAPIPVEAFSPAGAIAGLIAGVVTSAGWIATLIVIGVGWTIGLVIPATMVRLALSGRRQQQNRLDLPQEREISADDVEQQRDVAQHQGHPKKIAADAEISGVVLAELPATQPTSFR